MFTFPYLFFIGFFPSIWNFSHAEFSFRGAADKEKSKPKTFIRTVIHNNWEIPKVKVNSDRDENFRNFDNTKSLKY